MATRESRVRRRHGKRARALPAAALFASACLLVAVLPPSSASQEQFCGARDCYEMLGVRSGAKDVQIKKAYRQLARLNHPDKNPDDPDGAQERMMAINQAYDVLRDEVRRQDYDDFRVRCVAARRVSLCVDCLVPVCVSVWCPGGPGRAVN